MKYLNPFSLFDLDPEKTGPEQLKLLKKQVMAEFELHESAEIAIKGEFYDKNTLLNLIDSLQIDPDYQFHKQVYLYPGLLDFLTTGNYSQLNRTRLESLFNEKETAEQLAPFYLGMYSDVLLEAIRTEELEKVEKITDIYLPAKPKWKSEAYNRSFHYLMYYLKDAKSLSRKIEAARKYWDIIHLLPPYFDPVRHAYKAYWQYSQDTDVMEQAKELSRNAAPYVLGAAVVGVLCWMLFR